jgi:hypothetical protein
VPIVGETFEGHYLMGTRICDVTMESDYCKHVHVDLLTGQPTPIKQESETTYLFIEPNAMSRKSFRVFGNLTY